MNRKTIITLSITAFAIVSGYAGMKMYHSLPCDDVDLLMQNVEALSDPEPNNYNICYSESKVAKGYTYYDCGSCEKVYDEKGKGTYSKCFVK